MNYLGYENHKTSFTIILSFDFSRSGPSSMDHQSMAVRGGSGRFADSSSLTSVETMPSPKTEVRPYRKLSRRRSSLRDRENSIHLSHEPSKVLLKMLGSCFGLI